MENLAYLHLACAYEESDSPELAPVLQNWQQASPINWQRLSSLAWQYMLPLTIATVAVLGVAANAQALQKGDRSPEVLTLQQQLRRAGFFQTNPTGFYGSLTEDAVRRFQQANGLPINGIAGEPTIAKLQNYRPDLSQTEPFISPSASKTIINNNPVATQTPSRSATANIPTTSSNVTSANILRRGTRSAEVKALQERLRVAGFFYSNSSDFYGPLTEAAVKRFQEANGLNPDGIAGAATLAKLPSAGVGFGEENPQPVKLARDTLRRGDRGNDVKVLQEQLVEAGYLKGSVDGIYGAATEDAVRRFQQVQYLATSGIAGSTTRGKLAQVIGYGAKAETLSSANVRDLQVRLKERGFYNGPVNGLLGTETRTAIAQAQEFYGVSQKDIKIGRF